MKPFLTRMEHSSIVSNKWTVGFGQDCSSNNNVLYGVFSLYGHIFCVFLLSFSPIRSDLVFFLQNITNWIFWRAVEIYLVYYILFTSLLIYLILCFAESLGIVLSENHFCVLLSLRNTPSKMQSTVVSQRMKEGQLLLSLVGGKYKMWLSGNTKREMSSGSKLQ